ncbi:unnamed protein product, partial [Agarophyton chilense]
PADAAPPDAACAVVPDAPGARVRAPSLPVLPPASADTVRRILDWRQRASENHAVLPPRTAEHARSAVDAADDRLLNGEANSVVDSFGSISAHSLPVQHVLRRRDSFLSAGGVSVGAEHIVLPNGRNPFASNKTPKLDGLRFLLG